MRRQGTAGHSAGVSAADAVEESVASPPVDGEATGTNELPIEESGLADGTIDPNAGLRAELAALREQNETLTREAEQSRDQYLRTLAEFQNYRRRRDEESRTDRQFANRELVLALLPIIDNFERALAAAESSQNFEALMNGVSLTERQLRDFLSRNGVAPIEALGQEFDPNRHEAVMRVEDSGHSENTVVEELQRGYTMHDRVLRPSMVKVAGGG